MFLKRAGWSLWRHKFRNLLILLVFSAILAVTLTSFMIYAGTSHQVEVTQKAVANAVTLLSPFDGLDIPETYAQLLCHGPHIERYNIVINSLEMESAGLAPSRLPERDASLYKRYSDRLAAMDAQYLLTLNNWQYDAMLKSAPRPNQDNGGKEYRYAYEPIEDGQKGYRNVFDIYNGDYTPEENARFLEDYNMMMARVLDGEPVPKGFRVVAISDSEYFDSFSNEGYSLVEGRHFKSSEEDQPYVILSRAVAEANGIKLGDRIPFTFSAAIRMTATFYKEKPLELEVVGLFDPPEKDILGDIGYQEAAENMIFVPYQATFDYLYDLYNGETLLWVPTTNRATAYVDAPENVGAFLDFVYDNFRVVEINPETGRPVGSSIEELVDEGTFNTDDPDVVDAKFFEFVRSIFGVAPWFRVSIDREWYDMVAMPMENINSLSLFMGIGLLAGAFTALLLVCVFNVRGRKREVGVLLAMGESKLKIFAQMFLEQALPLVLAACIGFGTGVPLASYLGNHMLESRAKEVNAAYEQDKREYLDRQLNGKAITLESSLTTRSAAKVASPVKMQFNLNTALAWGYFALAFGMLFLTVLIQMGFLLRLSPAKIMTRRN